MNTPFVFTAILIALLAAAGHNSLQGDAGEGLDTRLALLRKQHVPIPPAGLLLFALFQLLVALVISSGICTGALLR